MSKLVFKIEKKSYLSKSLSYLFIGILLYLFIFYRISAPGSNPYFSDWVKPHNSFYLGVGMMSIIIFITSYTSFKYKDKKRSVYISRAVSFSMFHSPLMTMFLTPLLGYIFTGEVYMDPWIKVSISLSTILFLLLRLNIMLWIGKSDDDKVLSKGNNTLRVMIVLLASNFSLLIAVSAQEMLNGMGMVNSRTYIYTFWISMTLMGIQYIRYFWKIYKQKFDSYYLKVIDPTLPTVALVGVLSYIIFIPINAEINWYGGEAQTHLSGSIIMLTLMASTLVFGVFIKYLIYKIINSRPRVLKLLQTLNYENIKPWSLPTLTSLMILWNIYTIPENPEEISSLDNKIIKRVNIFNKEWYKRKRKRLNSSEVEEKSN